MQEGTGSKVECWLTLSVKEGSHVAIEAQQQRSKHPR